MQCCSTYKMESNCWFSFLLLTNLFAKVQNINHILYFSFKMVLFRQNIVWLSLVTLLIVFHVEADYDNTPQPSEEDNSSSEATIEDSNESRNKRSIEAANVDNNNKGGDGKSMARAGIPGLPDPMTILKVAEILQALGEKVVPILVEGNSVANLVAERLDKNYAFLKDLKSEIDSLTYQTKSM